VLIGIAVFFYPDRPAGERRIGEFEERRLACATGSRREKKRYRGTAWGGILARSWDPRSAAVDV